MYESIYNLYCENSEYFTDNYVKNVTDQGKETGETLTEQRGTVYT